LNKIKPFSNQDWDKFRSLEGMVRLVLITVWDPIGVFGLSQTLDEYDNYVLGVVASSLAEQESMRSKPTFIKFTKRKWSSN